MTVMTEAQPCAAHPDRVTGVQCNECHAPICAECQNMLGANAYCKPCVTRAVGSLQNAISGNPNWMGAIGLGVVAAGLGGYLWERVQVLLDLQIGFVAIIIGIAVGNAVMYGAGGKRGTGLQVLSLILTLVGIAFGLILSVHSVVLGLLAKNGAAGSVDAWSITFQAMPKILETMGPMTWVIVAIGVWQGFVVPKAPEVKV